MKKFIIKIILYSIPILLFYVFPICVIYLGKEYYTVKDVVTIQNNNKDTLYGTAYNNDTYISYKKLLFETNNPDVFVLGASRSIQIKKEFFSSSTRFINAGIPAETINDTKYFIENISPTKKRVLLLDIDREMLLMDYSAKNPHFDSYFSLFGFNFHLPLQHARAIYMDYFLRHKYSFINLIRSANKINTLGIAAFADENGFRSDGSANSKGKITFNSSAIILEANAKAKEILETKDNFSSLDSINITANLKTLQKILSLCKSKNIIVVGFIPPYMSAINNATLDKNSLNGERNIKMTDDISSIFKKEGFNFYDLSDISKYGGLDNEFFDTAHGTDLIYAKLSLYLAKYDKTMNKYFNTGILKDMIKKSKNNSFIF